MTQQQQQQQMQQQQQQQQPEVQFNRSTQGFPRSALDRAAAAKLRLEHNYKVSLQQAIERNQRYASSLITWRPSIIIPSIVSSSNQT